MRFGNSRVSKQINFIKVSLIEKKKVSNNTMDNSTDIELPHSSYELSVNQRASESGARIFISKYEGKKDACIVIKARQCLEHC